MSWWNVVTAPSGGLGPNGFQKRGLETEANDLAQIVPTVVRKMKQFWETCATEPAEYWGFGHVPRSTTVGGLTEEICSKQGTDKHYGINKATWKLESSWHICQLMVFL